jgi:hypothetical protein
MRFAPLSRTPSGADRPCPRARGLGSGLSAASPGQASRNESAARSAVAAGGSRIMRANGELRRSVCGPAVISRWRGHDRLGGAERFRLHVGRGDKGIRDQLPGGTVNEDAE